MCGIAGILNTDGAPASTILMQKMVKQLQHRGPDGDGVYVQDNVALGHARLATIDLSSAGTQPMSSADGAVVLTYNGMIYNYHELRSELQALGFPAPSSGDTAVLTSAWQAWGKDCLHKINGHFSFVVLDKKKNALYLARDRYGTHPLYWTRQGNIFLFASEIKALLAHPHCPCQMNIEALPEYFTFQNIFTNKTFFKGIHLFPRASVGYQPLNTNTLTIERYWDYNFNEDVKLHNYNECVEELDRLLRQSVNRQLLADVEVGAYLSGGIDSGLLSAYASQSKLYIKNFTCGFDISTASGIELGFDERTRAEAMSGLFKTEHYEMVLKSGDMERIMPQIMRHIETPRVGQSYPNYYIAQLASKFVKIVLSGSGGDELFAGYPWRYHRISESKNFHTFTTEYYNFWQRIVPCEEYMHFFAPMQSVARNVDTREIFSAVFNDCNTEISQPNDAINLSLYFEASTFLSGLLLIDDGLSMAHGLEARYPFLDNDVVDFAMRCPVRHKLRNLISAPTINENDSALKSESVFAHTADGKQILRKVAAKYIPKRIVAAKKQGFSAPDATWFKGESMNLIKRQLLQKNNAMYSYIDYATVSRLVTEHLHGKNNRRLLIWSLLCFDNWLRTFGEEK